MALESRMGSARIWSCARCGAHLANHEVIVSKTFHGRHGRAYLFEDIVNVRVDKHEERRLLTGVHIVADVVCNICETVLGWKYIKAYNEKEKYKEGKFLMEKAKMMRDKGWTHPS